MPASSRTSAANARPSILLLEEYDALSAAIGAALRKFAPEHDLAVAKSLRDAEIFAAKNTPELFVIDADPPWRGITDFLEKLRVKHASARALVIGAAIPAEIRAERRLSGALQFVDKPFELPAFGAAVQALLGPWRESQSTGRRGSLGSLTAIDIVLLHYAANATVIVDLRAGKTPFGEIEIYAGQVAHAEAGKLVGAEALREILTSPELRMRERSDVSVAQRTMKPTWQSMILEVLRSQPGEVVPEPEATATKVRSGKKIAVIDDTEMLLVFVEDVLTTADESLQVFTAKTGAEGLSLIENTNPDLVLLDYFLPDINGEEISRRLLGDERMSRIPVVMMSAHVPEITRAAESLDNIVATIEKPFFSKELVEIVQRSLTAPARSTRAKAAPPRARQPALPPQPAPHPPAPTPLPPKPEAPPPKEAALPPQPALPSPVRTPLPPKPVAPPSTETPLPPQSLAAPPAPTPLPPNAVTPPPTKAALPQRVAAPPASTLAPQQPLPSPIVVPPPAKPEQVAPTATPAAPPKRRALETPAVGAKEAVLGLFLEVLSMQFTPQLQMGSVRARPASPVVSLHLPNGQLHNAVPPEVGFQLGAAETDAKGQIAFMRLVPSGKPFQAAPTRNVFEIGSVAVVPADARQRVQLTPTGSAPMTVELLAHVEIAGVQLSPTFSVAQLGLRWLGSSVRVTLNPKAPETSAARFTITEVKLTDAGEIAELALDPAK